MTVIEFCGKDRSEYSLVMPKDKNIADLPKNIQDIIDSLGELKFMKEFALETNIALHKETLKTIEQQGAHFWKEDKGISIDNEILKNYKSDNANSIPKKQKETDALPIINVKISTSQLINNKPIKVFFNNKFCSFSLKSDIDPNAVYATPYNFNCRFEILKNSEYEDYQAKISYETLEISSDLAVFGGECNGLKFPADMKSGKIFKFIDNGHVRYITIKIVSEEELKINKEVLKEYERKNKIKIFGIILLIIWISVTILAFLFSWTYTWLISVIIFVLVIINRERLKELSRH